MSLSLRHRLVLTIVPLMVLSAVVGATGLVLLHRLGGRIDVILRENYDSVVAMVGLKEALERIDSSHQFALVSRHDRAAWPSRIWAVNGAGPRGYFPAVPAPRLRVPTALP